ncbi:hypothetical protein PDJAM_G00060810 [Pangasius djambal]|uniref:Uncharacterized protein n=1 Tax=Pangasius djambal TaxID=1691987 RepID=A0ACC5YY79_9TELE|nr:hypothetical protein [Pangasius djambal]
MGADGSKSNKNPPQHKEESHYSSGWRGFLSSLGVSVPSGLHIGSRRMIRDKRTSVPEDVLSSVPGPEKLHTEWDLPAFINMFLPEFPHRNAPGHEHFQILGYIAKGSFGPILKVKDKLKQKTYAVKVIPKSEILRLGVLDQSKEEVIVQRQVRHPFVHDLQDCWQTQHHLFIMCDYCSTGDLYTYWVMIGQFGEDAVKVFAAELGSALGKDFKGHLRLADFGLSRRLERGGRAFTICGTIQYMESDHCCMLRKVRCFPYEMPRSFSAPFALLLTELLCKTPTRRLRTLERFKRQTFFRGTPFDSQLLQKSPMDQILELKKRPDRPAKACRGLALEPFPNFDFDCDFLGDSTSTSAQETLTLANVVLEEALDQGQVPQGKVPQRTFL